MNRCVRIAVVLALSLTLSVHAQKSVPPPTSPLQARADSLFTAANYAMAIGAYEAFFKKDSSVSFSWNRYGYSLQKTNKLDQALVAYEHSLRLKPQSGLLLTVLFRVAQVYALKNDKASFFREMDTLMGAGYADIGGYDTIPEFAAMKADPRFAAMKSRIEANAYPCKYNPKYHLFDFWIGDWTAYPTSNQKAIAGWSHIESMAGGCGILENWTSNPTRGNFATNGPFEGKSINFYDSTADAWMQYWVGSGNANKPMTWFYSGKYDATLKALCFELDPGPGPNGEKQLGRFRFFDQGPDQFRQWQETSTDSGKTWVTTYDFTYKRKK